jgi:ABC-type nitrate/sulfonate/bicarbonate transport system substrate-binding protein
MKQKAIKNRFIRKNIFSIGITVLSFCVVAWIISDQFFEKNKTLSTELYLNWRFSGSFAGDAMAAKKFAQQNKIEIELKEATKYVNPLKQVGDNQFGRASAAAIIRAIEYGKPYVIIGVASDDHPAAFVASKASGIESPQDFIGKRIGILPFGSTSLAYKALLKKSGIDPRSLTEVPVYSYMEGFMSGRINDVQPMFIFDETVSLDRAKFEYNLIIPKDYGIVFKGESYFTTRNTLHHNPELVRRFIASLIEGWQFAANNPNEAIHTLAALSTDFDKIREKEVLSRGISYYVDGKRKPLDSDISTWQPFINDLVTLGHLKNSLNVDYIINLETVRTYYAKNKEKAVGKLSTKKIGAKLSNAEN